VQTFCCEGVFSHVEYSNTPVRQGLPRIPLARGKQPLMPGPQGPSLPCPVRNPSKVVVVSFKPLPPMRGMSGAGMQDESSSVTSTSTTSSNRDALKLMWCETQWVNLSLQARNLGLPKLPYFDPKTMLLSKEVNVKLWKQLVSAWHLAQPRIWLLTPRDRSSSTIISDPIERPTRHR
jgi:hypothetical protein